MQRIRQYDIKRIGNRESAVIKTVGGEVRFGSISWIWE